MTALLVLCAVLVSLICIAAAGSPPCKLSGVWKDRNGFIDYGSGKNGSDFSGELTVTAVFCADIKAQGTYVQTYANGSTTIVPSGVSCQNSNTTAGSCDLVCGFFGSVQVIVWNSNCTAYVDYFGDQWVADSSSLVASFAVLFLMLLAHLLA